MSSTSAANGSGNSSGGNGEVSPPNSPPNHPNYPYLHHPTPPQALTPLSSPTPPTPASTSSFSSSSSAVSRQSSIRSTTSVQAVPFRTPIRGNSGMNSSAMSRNGSGGMNTTPGSAMGLIGSGNSYFPSSADSRASQPYSAAPMGRRPSGGAMAAGESSMGLQPPIMESGLTNWSAVGGSTPLEGEVSNQGEAVEEGGGKGNLIGKFEAMAKKRPDLAAVTSQDSATLSDGPAKVKLKENSSEAIVTLRKTVQDFEFYDTLGEGSYSTVSLVRDKNSTTNKMYALKILDKDHIKREKKTKYVLIERDTLKMLDGHPGVVRLYWTFQDQRSLYFVLELAKNGELLKWIKKYGSFSLPSARYYAAQILSAIEHIHSRGVIHRDLKPENILLDDKMRVKITDFGTAKLLAAERGPGGVEEAEKSPEKPSGARTRSFVGTPEYVSPEILADGKGEGSSKASDYWGFGCILFQIIAGRPPFQAKTEYLMFQKIIGLEYEFPLGFPLDAKDLVEKLLVIDPAARLGSPATGGIDAIKFHPFFSSALPATDFAPQLEPIDFETIWKITPPELETGLTKPKEETKGTFVLQELDGFGNEDDEEAVGDEEDEDNDGVRRSASGEGSVSVGGTSESVGTGNGSARGSLNLTKAPATKWSGILLPRETILFASPIIHRQAFQAKHRTLILTDYPRLICIKEVPTRVTLKSEVFVGVKNQQKSPALASLASSVSSAASAGGDRDSKAGLGLLFVGCDQESDKIFLVRTNKRTFKYEEVSGSAGRWVSELNEAHEKGLVRHP